MKNGKTLRELADELDRQNASKEDMIAPTEKLTFKVEEGVNTLSMQNGHSIDRPISSIAMRQITDRMGIPSKYAEKLTAYPELLSHNINHWFQNEPKNQLIRVMDGKVRGVLSDRYAIIDNFEIASRAIPVFKQAGLRIVSCEITESRMYLKAISDRVQGRVLKVDDIVKAGVVVTNSEIGKGALTISPLIYRLICDNGMIAKDGKFKRHHLGSRNKLDEEDYKILSQETLQANSKAITLEARDRIEYAVSQVSFDKQLNVLKEAAGQPITGKPEKTIQVLSNNFNLTADEQSGVLQSLYEERDYTKWGVTNALTAYSQKIKDYDRATDFEIFGGKVIDMPQNEWRELATAS